MIRIVHDEIQRIRHFKMTQRDHRVSIEVRLLRYESLGVMLTRPGAWFD
jgi:hypothetical protein